MTEKPQLTDLVQTSLKTDEVKSVVDEYHSFHAGTVETRKANYTKMPAPDQSYDAVYAIEATCHAPDKAKLFTELFRVMKDGAEFAGYEWCLTKKYDKNNPEHRAIKKGIEEGDALPDIWYEADVVDALKQAGFEVLDSRDLAPTADRETPWELALSQPFSMSLHTFKRTTVGRAVTSRLV